jgi:hypothetical protein
MRLDCLQRLAADFPEADIHGFVEIGDIMPLHRRAHAIITGVIFARAADHAPVSEAVPHILGDAALENLADRTVLPHRIGFGEYVPLRVGHGHGAAGLPGFLECRLVNDPQNPLRRRIHIKTQASARRVPASPQRCRRQKH